MFWGISRLQTEGIFSKFKPTVNPTFSTGVKILKLPHMTCQENPWNWSRDKMIQWYYVIQVKYLSLLNPRNQTTLLIPSFVKISQFLPKLQLEKAQEIWRCYKPTSNSAKTQCLVVDPLLQDGRNTNYRQPILQQLCGNIIKRNYNFRWFRKFKDPPVATGIRGGAVAWVTAQKPEGRGFDSRWCH